MHRIIFYFLFSILISINGCIRKKIGELSAPKHTENELVNQTEPALWANLSFEEAVKIPRFPPLSAPVNPKEPVAQRVQFWLDMLWAKLAEKYPEKINIIPAPKVLLDDSGVMNAQVKTAPYCVKVSVKSAFPNAKELQSIGTSTDGITFLTEPYSEITSDCKEVSKSYLQSVSNIFNRHPMFKLDLDESGTFRYGGLGFSNNKLQFNPIGNWILVEGGLLKNLSEPSVIAVLAHELMHYVKAHGSWVMPMERFFYSESETPLAQKPKNQTDLQSLGDKFLLALTLPNNITLNANRLALSTLMQPILWNDFPKQCSTPICVQACQNFTQWRSEQDLGALGFLTEDSASPYKELAANAEKNLLPCLTQLNSAAIAYNFNKQAWTATVARTIAKPTQQIGMNASELLTQMSSYTVQISKEKSSIIAESQKMRLAWYTEEQEADEGALELLALLKISPASAQEFSIKLLKMSANLPGPFEGTNCINLFNNSWRNGAGVPIRVPVADFSDPHHSNCYRLYNTSREILAHNYPLITDASLPFLSATDWQKLSAHLK